MSDTVFRQQVAPEAEQPLPEGKDAPSQPIVNDVPVPYLDASNFLEEYFNIGTEWKDHDASFYKELEGIDSYLKTKIESKELPNDQVAIRNELKKMERLNNLNKEQRSVIRLEVLANYVEFMKKNDNLKSNLKRYADA